MLRNVFANDYFSFSESEDDDNVVVINQVEDEHICSNASTKNMTSVSSNQTANSGKSAKDARNLTKALSPTFSDNSLESRSENDSIPRETISLQGYDDAQFVVPIRGPRSHTEGSSPHQCQICSLKVRTRRNLQLHMKSVHEGPGPKVSCNIDGCTAFFNTKWSLSFHKRKIHNLQAHVPIKKLRTEEIYRCAFCKYSSSKKGNVERHTASRHGASSQLRSGYRYECDRCHRKFIHKNNLVVHNCSAADRN